MRSILKSALRFLFPTRHRYMVHRLKDLRLAIIGNADEVQIVYRLLDRSPGKRTMIDVGAHYGGSLRRFADAGWRVFAFEPDPENRKRLEALAADYDWVTVDSRAVSNEKRDDLALFSSEVSSGISGLSSFHPSHREAARVSTIPLGEYCSESGIESVDFLKVDTEGWDLFVLRSFDWDKIQPRVVVCEFEDRKTKPLGYTYRDMAEFLVGRGYLVLLSEWYPIVEYGTQHKWRRFRLFPSDLAGGEVGHGNFIAVRTEADLDRLRKLIRWLNFRAWVRGE